MSTPSDVAPPSSLGHYLYFSSLYFVSVGVLYIWGYWSRFEINILSYLSFTDILKSTALPIALSALPFVAGILIAEYGIIPPIASGGGRENTVGKVLNRFKKWIGTAYLIAVALLLVYGPDTKWLVLPMLLAPPLALMINETPALAGWFPNHRLRSVLIVVALVISFTAYGQGRIDAGNVLSGTSFFYLVNTSGSAVPSTEAPRLLGNAGELYFFWLPVTKEVLIDKPLEHGALKIAHFKKGREEALKSVP